MFKSNENIKMTFECNQNWDTMKITSCGRYCEVCQKEVIDFTKHSIQDFNISKNIEFCGKFSVEQADPFLIKPIKFPFKGKILLYFSTIIMTLNSKNVIALNDKPKIEIIDFKDISKDTSQINSRHEIKKTVYPEIKLSPPNQPFFSTKKRMFYWSKKFPFITVIKKRYTMGMHVRFL
jgi:hypothetical protein